MTPSKRPVDMTESKHHAWYGWCDQSERDDQHKKSPH